MTKRKQLYSDLGTPERRQHGKFVLEAVPADMVSTKNRDRLRAVETSDPLWQYKRAGTINRAQRDAGLRLRELWNRTGLEPKVIGAYEEMISSGSVKAIGYERIDRYHVFQLAIKASGASSDLITVCCLQQRVARNRGKHLRGGLSNLVRYFGI